jgi:SAM-dependent methyltransferase
VKKMSDDTAAFIGSIPEYYDNGLGPIMFADYAADIAQRAAATGAERVLEIAAGTGIVTRRLRDLLPAQAHLTASDLNPPMLDAARGKFGPHERVEFRPADATSLSFPDGSFDAVVCQFGVMFFPDKDKAYREVHRVLAPGGHYLFNVWDSMRFNPFARIAHDVIGSFFASDPPPFYAVPFSYAQIDPIKQSLIDAGFIGIAAHVIGWDKEIADVARFAKALIFGNPTIDQIRARGGDPEAVVVAIENALRREFALSAGRMPLQAILFEARKA